MLLSFCIKLFTCCLFVICYTYTFIYTISKKIIWTKVLWCVLKLLFLKLEEKLLDLWVNAYFKWMRFKLLSDERLKYMYYCHVHFLQLQNLTSPQNFLAKFSKISILGHFSKVENMFSIKTKYNFDEHNKVISGMITTDLITQAYVLCLPTNFWSIVKLVFDFVKNIIGSDDLCFSRQHWPYS